MVFGSIDSKRPMPFKTTCCTTEHDAMLSSLPSSHLPWAFIDAIPSETTTGHDGERFMSMNFVKRRLFVRFSTSQFSVCARVDFSGPVFACSSARSLRMRWQLDSGQSGHSLRRWRMPFFSCGSQSQMATVSSLVFLQSPPPTFLSLDSWAPWG